MASNSHGKKKKYPILGIRIDDDISNELEAEAARMGGKSTKSAVAKQAIRQWLLFFKPTEIYERMILYKNVFGFCLDQLSDEKLRELSQLVMQNTFEKNPPNNPNIDEASFMKEYNKMTPDDIMNAFEEIFLEARGVGRGWYSNIAMEYNEKKDLYYLALTHQVSKSFSKFLYVNLLEMIQGYTFLDVEFLDPYYGDTKVTFHVKILGIRENIKK